jgi:heme-degrading monooxygenase HmoA
MYYADLAQEQCHTGERAFNFRALRTKSRFRYLSDMKQPISTLTFFRFSSFKAKFWAFGQMQFAHASLKKTPGLQFYKLMGSGREIGFNPLPDWGVYALLAVWENEAAAEEFFSKAEIYQQYLAQSSQHWTIFLKTRQAKGLWSGGNPFSPSTDLDEDNPRIAVITRATIRPSKLLKFWRYVPISQRPIQQGCEGLIFTKGIGEVPLMQMATFSLWENMEALKNYAYNSPEHQVAIQKTRQLDWYKEEMFVRFQPYKFEGEW